MKKEADIIYLKKRKIKHWIIVLIFLVIILLCIKLRIKTVNVKGNPVYYTEEEARELVFSDYWDSNTLLCLIRSIRGTKKTLPFISDYQIALTGPESCDLIIYEKKPVGCVIYMSNYLYFDKDGYVIESSEERLEGVPVIKGVNFGHIVLGQKLPVSNEELFTDIMNITQQLAEKNISCDSIGFDELKNITLTLDNGDIDVYIGQNDYLEVKLSGLADMLPKIEEKGLKGTLDLSGYQDSEKDAATSFKLRTDGTGESNKAATESSASDTAESEEDNTEETSEAAAESMPETSEQTG